MKTKPYKRPDPLAGETYKHYSGITFKILGLAEDLSEDKILVIYQPTRADTPLYARELSAFLSIKDDGAYIFEQIK